jgi:hypothetical protein
MLVSDHTKKLDDECQNDRMNDVFLMPNLLKCIGQMEIL